MAEGMKDSGVEWIGLIPDSWEIDRIKYQFSLINGYSFKSDYYSDNGIRVIRISDVEDDYLSDKDVRYYPESFREQIGEAMLKQYDILVSLTGYLGKCYMVKSSDGEMGLNQRVGVLRRIGSKYDSMYMKRVLQCEPFRKEMELSSNGSAQLNMSTDWLKNNSIPKPSLAEQRMIAVFLDEKCAEINKLSEDIKRQIDILEEYKKSVITRAVTKGFDPNVKMKESGIEWVGEIPESWVRIRLKDAAWLKGRIGWQGLRAEEFVDDEELPYLITGTDFTNGIVNWNSCAHITKERFEQDKNIQIKENDLLITKDGTIGKVAVAKNCPNKVSLNSGVFIIRNVRRYKYYSRFMYYVLQSDEFLEWYIVSNAGNSTILHLNQEKFYNFSFVLPPFVEQEKIANYLDRKCGEIDVSIEAKNEQLEKLANYKKSIIYEYVTGKKRVV